MLGRHPLCDVCIDAASVSGRHAKLREENGQVEIADMGSSYGTFVGDARVDGWAALPEGAEAWIGDVQITARLIWPTLPTPVTVHSDTARSAFTLDTDADTLGPRELSDFPALAPLLPLVFARERGVVTHVIDATGESRLFGSGSVTVNGVVIAFLDDAETMASMVAPRPFPAQPPEESAHPSSVEVPAPAASSLEAPQAAADARVEVDPVEVSGSPQVLAPRSRSGARADWILVVIGVVALIAFGVFFAWIL